MANATPLPCTLANCGDNFIKCGRISTYRKRCRCQSCCAVKAHQAKRWNANNADKVAASAKLRREQNREEISLRRSKNRQDNIDLRLKQERDARFRNREAALERTRRWRERNPEKVSAGSRRWRQENPERNREIKRDAFHRRKARLIEAFVENVNRLVVFERDDYICQICGIECSTEVDWPAKNFATLDHIIPLAKGGSHEYANVQLLCLRCNTSKGARFIG